MQSFLCSFHSISSCSIRAWRWLPLGSSYRSELLKEHFGISGNNFFTFLSISLNLRMRSSYVHCKPFLCLELIKNNAHDSSSKTTVLLIWVPVGGMMAVCFRKHSSFRLGRNCDVCHYSFVRWFYSPIESTCGQVIKWSYVLRFSCVFWASYKPLFFSIRWICSEFEKDEIRWGRCDVSKISLILWQFSSLRSFFTSYKLLPWDINK